MERRVLFAIFLSFLVLYAYQALVVKPVPKQPAPAASGASPTANGTAAATKAPAAAQAPLQPESVPPAIPREATPIVGDSVDRDVRIETRDVIAVFTNRGARLKSWRLKHYRDQQHQPQELIENRLAGQPLPFTLRTGDEALNATLNGALYSMSGAPVEAAITSPVDLRFEYQDSSGVHAVKQFHLSADAYLVEFRSAVTDHDRLVKAAVVWGPAVGDFAETTRGAQTSGALLFDNNGKVQRLSVKDLAKQPVYDGDFRLAGVDDNYFLTAALTPGSGRVSYQSVAVPPSPPSKDPARELVSYAIEPARDDAPLKFFVGPKDFDVLSTLGPEYTRAINFGVFSVIVVPLLKSLKWVNGFIGNYGWSIVVLTILINVVMFPLQHKSIVSMRKMQEIQPQIKAIQDRYAKYSTTDPERQKMNQEMMALYRERGVNPASGCVPMLLTLPVLYAMWAMLTTAIELRGAPFVGWIHDLTARDPYYVTPVLMGVTQFWQQKITPAAGADPAQQRMMMIMPLVMTVMFLWLPAGALIYYTVGGVLRIGQQYMTNYLIGPPNVRVVRPPAERRLKRVGAGKTEAADTNASGGDTNSKGGA